MNVSRKCLWAVQSIIVFSCMILFFKNSIHCMEPQRGHQRKTKTSPSSSAKINLEIIDLLRSVDEKWKEVGIVFQNLISAKNSGSEIEYGEKSSINNGMILVAEIVTSLCSAYRLGYESALDQAYEKNRQMSIYLQDFILDRDFTFNSEYSLACQRLKEATAAQEDILEQYHENKKRIQLAAPRLTLQPTQKIFAMINDGDAYNQEVAKVLKEFSDSRSLYLNEYLRHARHAAQSFYSVHYLGCDKCEEHAHRALLLFDSSRWLFPKEIVRQLRQVRKNLKRLGEITVRPPAPPSGRDIVSDKKQGDISLIKVEYSMPEDTLLSAVSLYNKAISLIQNLNECKKNDAYEKTLDHYFVLLDTLLQSYKKGFPQALESACQFSNELSNYKKTILKTVVLDSKLICIQDEISREFNIMEAYYHQIKKKKKENFLDESDEYVTRLMDTMKFSYNYAVEEYFKALCVLADFFKSASSKIDEAARPALLAGERYAIAQVEGFPRERLQSKSCISLFDKKNWQLSKEEQVKMRKGQELLLERVQSEDSVALVKVYEQVAHATRLKNEESQAVQKGSSSIRKSHDSRECSKPSKLILWKDSLKKSSVRKPHDSLQSAALAADMAQISASELPSKK